MEVLRTLSSAFNVHTTHFCLYAALLLLALYLFKTNHRSAPSKAALLSQIAASSAVYGRAAASMLKPTAEHRQRLRSTDAWKKVEEVERDLGHSQQQPGSSATDADFMFPSKIVTRHLYVALNSDSDTFNLYTVQHNLLVGCIQWLSSPSQAQHFDVAKRASQGKVRGCFALTELGLGVLSGSTVRTRLLDAPGGGFHLDNYDDAAAAKVWISCAADPELEFAIVIALYEPQRLMIPVLLRIRHQPRADLVKGVHITGAPYSTRQVMKGNCFGAISFDKVHVAAADVMSAFVSVDAAAPPSSRFILAKGDTRAVYHVRLLNRLIVGRVLFPAAGMVFLMRGISAVTHPDLVKEKLDRPWIRSVLAQALREHDGMRRQLSRVTSVMDQWARAAASSSSSSSSSPAPPFSESLVLDVAFIKAVFCPRVCETLARMRMLMGGAQILDRYAVYDDHNNAFLGVVAEGDSFIMAQYWLRGMMSSPALLLKHMGGLALTAQGMLLIARLAKFMVAFAFVRGGTRGKLAAWDERQEELMTWFKEYSELWLANCHNKGGRAVDVMSLA